MMEPSDQNLCIVPDRGRDARDSAMPTLLLPFEGDTMLSVILSKAVLLASDTTIQDPAIVGQMRA